ncbi:pentatricopeptide repeat-containing protein At4g20740 [Macadamia integrifolia]|uniref:pentatricopeptide repeat-containing protein At4g20740 n=1 Tax=Macadamia integrifolia TaxID=60698 RepID=UPI001C4FC4B1|nr:pentatricopeptide repeat-containing protein At4g20740 [Macadamia integrifolia]XP_042498194.1 pentatricopeptide repeat-containing protein At4g20740 [Macadamia integrifolia]XP_042498195.1 pentatricopeptide repeat-containing protein At4g20740 [Macadamia integrifolia]XP_042498196.1 pentatricopeptide repeat-containing protein At4g20740 [Macadamia integrifolia]XP_042498197.1 pentatricopeptide repeat-containing protein At4g20740 [Macadamia integrifolia]
MPPEIRPLATNTSKKFYFFYGHRKPSQNRPTVRGGIFSNRKTSNPNSFNQSKTQSNPSSTSFDLQKWDPNSPGSLSTPPTKTPSEKFFSIAQTLSPIARYICDSFHRNKHWGPSVITDLSKLRRVTPQLVAEVLKVQSDPRISSKFFHWAGKQKGYQHNFASYNAFAYCLNRTNQFRAADQLPELMNMQGKQPSEKQFEILIRMHSDAGRGLRVYYVYEKMKKFGVKPRVFLYNRIMDALVKTDHLDLALSVYEDFKEDGLVEENVTYMILIKGLCKAGRADEVFELLGRMKGNLCKPDVFAYTAMIRVLVSEGNLDGCLRVWEEMCGDGVEPDVMAYTTLITGLCKGNEADKGYELFKEMREKGYLIDRAVYGSLIEAFVANRRVGLACDLLKDLMDSGYRADLSIYNSLIKGLCNVNQVDKAYKLFQITAQEGLSPDFVTINPILVALAEQTRMNDFCQLLEQMLNLGSPVIHDLPKFFSFLVEKGDRELTALQVFKDLKEKGYSSVAIYNILIGALHSRGDIKEALSLFNEMKNSDVRPDSSTYSTIIPCFVEIGDLKEASVCYNKMNEISGVPTMVAYISLVKGLCKIGEIDAALLLVRDCLASVTSGPMEFKYTLTILHACKSGNADKVIEVLNEMMQQGFPPDDIIYSAVIYGMCKRGTLEEGRKVFVHMKERGLLRESDMIVYDELLIDHMKKKTASLVLSGLKFFGLESKLKSRGSTLLLS